MITIRRAARTLAVTAALAAAGATTAHAMSWGTLSVSHDGSLRGQGKGTLTGHGWDVMKLTTSLSDTRPDGTRTYAEARGYGNDGYVGLQSGRRDDGGTQLVRMYDHSVHAQVSVRGFRGKVRVCQDRPWRLDWCGSWSPLEQL